MPGWRNSWSEYAATTGFTVNTSRSLGLWYGSLFGCGSLALFQAPCVSITAVLALLPGLMLRGRTPVWPWRIRARHVLIDPGEAPVSVRVRSDTASHWALRSWFRHPALIILYLHHPTHGYGCVVLPRDALASADRRRLHYVLGVSTVGSGESAGSGASKV